MQEVGFEPTTTPVFAVTISERPGPDKEPKMALKALYQTELPLQESNHER